MNSAEQPPEAPAATEDAADERDEPGGGASFSVVERKVIELGAIHAHRPRFNYAGGSGSE